MSLSRRGLLAAAAAAPLFATRGARAAAGDVIRSVPIGNLQVLDPIWTTAYITRNHAYMVWDTLFALDAANRPQPQMAEGYDTSADGLTWTIRLRPGLEWHDGGKVRAADCVASIRRWGAKDGMGRALLAATDTLAPLDDRSIRLTLFRRIGFVIDALGKIDSNVPFMMPERLAQTGANTQIKEVVGSGPFRFVAGEWVPGAKVVYEKFDGYVPRSEPPSQAAGGKVVKVRRVESIYTPDAATAANGLVAGEFDLLESPPPDLVPLLRRAAGVKVEPDDPLGYQLFMLLNHLHPPFDSLDARRAVQMAVKQSDFLQATVGEGTPWRECAAAYGCTPGDDPGMQALGWPAYDPAAARALLAKSGYDGRKLVVLDPADNATLHPPALVAAQMLRDIGAAVDVQAMDWSTLIQRRASKAPADKGGWDVFITNATVTGIANPLLDIFAGQCEQAWYGWPCNRSAVDLAAEWAAETDAAKRQAIGRELERLIIADVTLIPLGQYRSLIAYRDRLSGIIPAPALFYWNVAVA